MSANLAGRSALVAGGGRGIGAAIATELVTAGARVVVAARTAREVEAVAATLSAKGGEAYAVAADVSGEYGVGMLVNRATGLLGAIDLLVNAAGAGGAAPLERLSLEDWDVMLSSHATSAFLLTRALVPMMRERGFGRIVHVASVAGLEGGRYIAHYAAAQHAVVGLVRAVACELAGSGVTIHALCPAYVDTPMTRQTIENVVRRTGRSTEDSLRAVLTSAGQERLLSADEAAAAALALLRLPSEVNGRIEPLRP